MSSETKPKNNIKDSNILKDDLKIEPKSFIKKLILKGLTTICLVLFSVFSLFIIITFALYIATVEKSMYEVFTNYERETLPNSGEPINTCYIGVTSACLQEGVLKPIHISSF